MKKIYKIKTGKQLLKMFYKGKIKDQLIVEDVRGNHRIGLYIGEEHYCTGRSLSLHALLSNNTFYIYTNTKENIDIHVYKTIF